MDFVPSSLANPSNLVGSTLSGVTIVASTSSGLTLAGTTTITGTVNLTGVMLGGTISGTALVSVSVNSGSTISVYALPTRQFVHANRSGSNQGSINNNTFTKVNYTNEVFDAAGVFDLSNERMTPTIAGKYLVLCAAAFSDAVIGDFINSSIYKNGSQIAQVGVENSNNQNNTIICSAYVDMNGSTDYLEHFVRQVNAATTDRTLDGSTDHLYFMAMWMST